MNILQVLPVMAIAVCATKYHSDSEIDKIILPGNLMRKHLSISPGSLGLHQTLESPFALTTSNDTSKSRFKINGIAKSRSKIAKAVNRTTSIDLSKIAHRLTTKLGWSLDLTTMAIAEYRRFLVLGAVKSQREWHLVPTQVIDEVWHAHILHTRQYVRDCEAIFGHYFHHSPSSATGNSPEKHQMREWHKRTISLYQTVFGSEPPVTVWPMVSNDNCSKCDGDCDGPHNCQGECDHCATNCNGDSL